MLPTTFTLKRGEEILEGDIIEHIKQSLRSKYGERVFILAVHLTRPNKNKTTYKGEKNEETKQ